MIKKIIYLAFLLPLAGNAQTTVIKPLVKQPTAFAIITDNQTYANTKDAMHQYKTAVEDDGLATYLISGEVAAAFLYTSQVSAALQARPDLEVVYPKEGLGFGIMAGFIPSQAPNADAAYTFLDYINDPENAAKCYEYIGYYCTVFLFKKF